MTALDLGEIQERLLTDEMMEKPFKFDDLGLVALPTAVSVARLFTRYVLENWHAPAPVVADATIITGELVKLSVQDAERLSEIRVRLLAFRRYVAVEVWDMATKNVEVSEDVTEQPDGIDLVDVIAQAWTSGINGQTRITWAEVGIYDITPSGLPVRAMRTTVRRPERPATDYELLRKVRDGLKGL